LNSAINITIEDKSKFYAFSRKSFFHRLLPTRSNMTENGCYNHYKRKVFKDFGFLMKIEKNTLKIDKRLIKLNKC